MTYWPPTKPSGSSPASSSSSKRVSRPRPVAAARRAKRGTAMARRSSRRIDLVDEVVHLVQVPVKAGQRIDLIAEVQLDLLGEHDQRPVVSELRIVGARGGDLGVQVRQRTLEEAAEAAQIGRSAERADGAGRL